jgi:hypothetical protein
VCAVEGIVFGDGTISVAFKPLAGSIDQAAGMVWRMRDADNYYVVRANALERNVVLYKVQEGTRSDLKPVGGGLRAYGTSAAVEANRWHELRVVARGTRFSVFLDAKQLFDVDDTTFRDPGKVGIWTKADSVTAFDDLTVEPASPSPEER